MNKDIFRIIDANLNRSREGLRVCEDITRFVLNSSAITRELKNIRHHISDAAKRNGVSCAKLCAARDSREDVGASMRLASEMMRRDLVDIFAANMERVKESLRVLEEIFKLVDIDASAKMARLRFKAYDVEKKAVKRIESLRNSG